MSRLNRILVSVAAALLAGCHGRHRAVDLVYVCDHSTSSRCGEENIRRGFAPLIRRPIAGSRGQAIAVGCGSDDAESIYEVIVPDRWGGGVNERKRMWSETESRHLGTLRLRRPQPCSGIVGAISRGVRILRQSERPRRRLLVDSDLREASDETGFNFERSIPKPADFVETVKRHGLLPNLDGIEVVVCDVHEDSSPNARRWSARQSSALHADWSAYFAEAGAPDVEFLERCPWQESADGEIAWAGSQ